MKDILIRKIYNLIKLIIVTVTFFFPLKKRIVVESFLGNKDDDNILGILQLLDNTYKVYYVQKRRNKTTVLFGERVIKNSIKYIWLFHTSKLIITNSRLHHALIKKKNNQKVIQMWHGIPWKKLVHDQENIYFQGQNKDSYLDSFDSDVMVWDYLWAPSEYAVEKFTSAFKFNGEFLKQMYPADCELLSRINDNNEIFRIKKMLDIDLDKKVLLYMPTFRENKMISSGKYAFVSTFNIEKFMEKQKDTVLLVRGHYLVQDKITLNNKNVMDVSGYKSVSDLYLIADVLITDYSSAIYSYSLLKKPIISVQSDREDYVLNRGLYPDGIKRMSILEIRDENEIYELEFSNILPSKPQKKMYEYSEEVVTRKIREIMNKY